MDLDATGTGRGDTAGGRFSGIPSGPPGHDALWDLLDHSRMGGAIQFCTD
jgi:hypothetical protein